jgi:hypothetical protein
VCTYSKSTASTLSARADSILRDSIANLLKLSREQHRFTLSTLPTQGSKGNRYGTVLAEKRLKHWVQPGPHSRGSNYTQTGDLLVFGAKILSLVGIHKGELDVGPRRTSVRGSGVKGWACPNCGRVPSGIYQLPVVINGLGYLNLVYAGRISL